MILQEFSVKSMENYFITVSSKQREEKNMPNVVYCKSLGCRHHVDKVKKHFLSCDSDSSPDDSCRFGSLWPHKKLLEKHGKQFR